MGQRIERLPAQSLYPFLIISLGQLLSMIGSSLSGFAFSIWIYDQTRSVTEFALVGLFSALPNILIVPIAGALVDRYDRRRIIILTEIALFVSASCMFVLFSSGRLAIWHVYVLAAINAGTLAFLVPAYSTLVPMLVPKERLGQANSITQTTLGINQIVAPLLAGILVMIIGIGGVLLIDLLTGLVPITIMLAMRIPGHAPAGPRSEPAPGAPTSLRQDAGQGWRYLRARRGLLALLILFALTNFVISGVSVLVTPLVLSFATPATLGVLFSVGGVGMLAGGLLLGAWGGPRRRIQGVAGFMTLGALCLIIAGLRPSVPLLAVCAFGFFFATAVSNGCMMLIWQTKVEPALQGRVFALTGMVMTIAAPLVTIVVGPLADQVFTPALLPGGRLAQSAGQVIGVGPGRGIALMFIIAGTLNLITLAVSYGYPRLRRLDGEVPDALPGAPAPPAPAGSRRAPQRRAFAVLRWALALALVAAGLAGTGGYLYVRHSLPVLAGTLTLAGPRAQIEIIRDSDAVPHIYAQNQLDAYFGLGYVHAQDRLWQMEFQRRVGRGSLAQILGPAALVQDRYSRALGVYRAAERAWEHVSPPVRASVQAYVDGINAFQTSNSGAALPLEFSVFGVAPEPWSGPDVLVWIKMMAFNLGGDGFRELFRSNLADRVGVERALELLREESEHDVTILPAQADGSYAGLLALDEQFRALLGTQGAQRSNIGSNSWVVDGTKSTTGAPLLANDPHLTTGIPAIWYLAHLSAPGLDVIGATIPGLPGVVIGRNRQISWGITNFNPDVQDFYRERLDPSGRLVEFQGVWEPIQVVTETIKVKGQPDVLAQVRSTRHGPLISDVINAGLEAIPPSVPPDQRPQPVDLVALRWTALDPDDTTIEAFLQIAVAQNWSEFTAALRGYVAPALNFIYADRAGNIGYYGAGRIPIRATPTSGFPAEGWSGASEWTGAIPFEALPHTYNPPEHFIVTANNRPTGAEYPYFLGRTWAPRYRAQRITELLQSKARLSPDDFAAMQADTLSIYAREMTPLLLALVEPQDATEQRAVALLRGWNYDIRGDSAAAAIFELWLVKMKAAVLNDELGSWRADSDDYQQFLLAALARPDNPWCDDIATGEREDCRLLARQTLQATLNELKGSQGADLESWRWDHLHRVVFPQQPFDSIPLLQAIFSRARPHGGDSATINYGGFGTSPTFTQQVAASYRQIVDLSGLEGGRFIQAIGQSGHILSPHYDDYLADWLAVRHRPMRLDRAAVERDRRESLILTP